MNKELFEQRYQDLNKEQKQAVDTLYGPVMVVAGPGTGKTEILSLRIVNILQTEKAINPAEILALTFTESGVQAMRQRLSDLIGATAHKLNLFTFHSFCNQIIQDHAEEFVLAAEVKLITEIELIKLLKKLINSLNKPVLKPFGAPYLYLKDIQNKIKTMKQEDISPEKLKKALQKKEQELKNIPPGELYHQKGAHKGKKKSKYKDREKDLSKQKELAKLYEGYQKELKQGGRYDFEDMIMFVVEKFRNDADFRQSYQEKFKFILLDEYQDTNNSQNTIIEQLVRGDNNPNLFVVGDDDQAIYRFQGASMENFLFFHKIYPSLKIISLKKNYRNTQTIIDGALSLINNNNGRITNIVKTLTKSFKASMLKKEIPITKASLNSESVEYFYIVEKIKELHTKHKTPYKHIAVLYRNNKNARPLTELFKKDKIPFSLSAALNVLDNFYIQKLISFLQILDNPYNNEEFFNYLYAGFFPIKNEDIFKMTSSGFEQQKSLFELSVNLEKIPKIAKETKNTLSEVNKIINELKKESYRLTLKQLVIKTLHKANILPALLKKPGNLFDLNQINSFINWLEKYTLDNNTSYSIKQLLEDLSLLNESEVPIPSEALPLSKEGVQLMTAHKSKGLEFPVVFLIRCHSKNLEKQSNKEKLKLPPNLVISQNNQYQVSDNQDEEERRLFYVASTRAKEKLFYTYATKDELGNELEPSVFLSEIDKQYLKEDDGHTYAQQIEKRIVQTLKDESSLEWEKEVSSEYLKRLVEKYALSPTALNSYLKCPAYFKYSHLYRIPLLPNKHMVLGSAIHQTLEKVFTKANDEQRMTDLNFWRETYKKSSSKNFLPAEEKQAVLEEGLKLLKDYYLYYQPNFHLKCLVEYDFSNHNVFLEKIPLTGKLDKIEIFDNSLVNIIDYKTGKPKSRNEITGKTKNSTAEYFRQLVFYKLLAELDDEFPYKINQVILDFIRPRLKSGEYVREEFEITNSETSDLKNTIKEVYGKIQHLEFAPQKDASSCQGFKQKCSYYAMCHKANV